jgi:hypothetical protein
MLRQPLRHGLCHVDKAWVVDSGSDRRKFGAGQHDVVSVE